MTNSPTISIGVWEDRLEKLDKLIAAYRRENRPITRTEIFWYGIDALYAIKCPSKQTDANAEGQRSAA